MCFIVTIFANNYIVVDDVKTSGAETRDRRDATLTDDSGHL